MNPVLRNTILLLKILKVFFHLIIIGMAIFFITVLALNPKPANALTVVQYIFYILMIAANIFPVGDYYALPHVGWLGFNLLSTLVNKGETYGLVDNEVILEYLNHGPFPEYGSEIRTRLLFYASLVSWAIVFVALVASLSLGMGLNALPIRRRVPRKPRTDNVDNKDLAADVISLESGIEVTPMEDVSLESDNEVILKGCDKKESKM